MPTGTLTSQAVGERILDLVPIAANAISTPVLIQRANARISVHPSASATVRVYKSSSPHSLIVADQAAGRLSYANFNSGDLSTLSSNWVLWASGGVTVPSTEGQQDSSGWTAVIATATGGSGTSNLEVVQDP